MFKCTLAIGTNLGNREENIKSSLSLIHRSISQSTICVSSIIETQAITPENAPNSWNISYLNCVTEFFTRLSPEEILIQIKTIEKKMGRDLNSPKWSPRLIDIDILYYSNQTYKSPKLQIPHPEIQNRAFLKALLQEFSN